MACEDSRMSFVESELSNTSPCKVSSSSITSNTETTSSSPSSAQRRDSSEKKVVIPHKQVDELVRQEAKESSGGSARRSWFEIVEAEENTTLETGEREEDATGLKSSMDLSGTDSKMSVEECGSNSNMSFRSNRQIEIDILDSANVVKYEKLVRDDKIKSPFKRRLSGDDEDGECANDDSANDGPARFDAGNHKKSKTHKDDHGRERFRSESSSGSSTGDGDGDGSSQSSRKPIEYETDQSIIERRQKQIDYGKNTLGYENYLKQVPRKQRTKDHPKTPPKHIKYSRRAWDGLVKVWRKKLHCFDPDAKPDAQNAKGKSNEICSANLNDDIDIDYTIGTKRNE